MRNYQRMYFTNEHSTVIVGLRIALNKMPALIDEYNFLEGILKVHCCCFGQSRVFRPWAHTHNRQYIPAQVTLSLSIQDKRRDERECDFKCKCCCCCYLHSDLSTYGGGLCIFIDSQMTYMQCHFLSITNHTGRTNTLKIRGPLRGTDD